MAGIWSPSLIDYYNRNSTGDGQLVIDADPSAPTDFSTNLINRGQKTKAACYNPDSTLTTDPKGFFGQAQYRLQTFKNKFDPTLWSEQSICDAANYPNALNNIAEARCDRELRCNNVGQVRRYESSQTCRTVVRNDFSRDLNPAECQGGIDRAELSECMSDIRTEDCNNPIDTLSRLAACRTSDLCRANPSPVSMR